MQYNKRQQSEIHIRRSLKHFPEKLLNIKHNLVIKRGKCQYLYDYDQNRYIDLYLQDGKQILGHSNPLLTKYVKNSVSKGENFGLPSKIDCQLAEQLKDIEPSFEKVAFFENEFNAYISALLTCQKLTGNKKCIYLGEKRFNDFITETIPLTDYKKLEEINDLACIIINPLATGFSEKFDELSAFLNNFTQNKNTILIMDEINSLFRYRFGSSATQFGIVFDLTLSGSIITSGLPFGILAGKESIINEIITPNTDNKISISPIILTAGLSVIKEIRKSNFYDKAKYLLNDLKIKLKGQIKISASNTLFRLDIPNRENFISKCTNNGVFLLPSNSNICYISLCHNENDIKYIAKQFLKQ